MAFVIQHTSPSPTTHSGSPTTCRRRPTSKKLYSVSVITKPLEMVLHANSEMAGDDRGSVEVL